MKKVILLLTMLCIVNLTFLNAQTTKGKFLFGVSSALSLAGTGSNMMSFGFSSTEDKSDASGFTEDKPDKTVSINFLPKVGYFIVNNLAIGLDISYAFSKEKDGDDDYEFTDNLLSAGPFVRYYVPTSKVKPFMEISGAYGGINMKYKESSYDDQTNKSSLISFGGGVGLAVTLGEKVTFDGMVGYNSMVIKDKKDNPDNNRSVIGTLGLNLGFTVYLGSEK
jgi:hypothetical protein